MESTIESKSKLEKDKLDKEKLDIYDTLDQYLIVNNYDNNKGQKTTEFKEYEGKLIIKQYTGINSENFVIKKFDGKKISFSFFKLNGIYYVNINGEHVIDYRKFINIQQISKIDNDSIKLKNLYIGEIIIHNCDPEMFYKALSTMYDYMKIKSNYISDFMYFIFH